MGRDILDGVPKIARTPTRIDGLLDEGERLMIEPFSIVFDKRLHDRVERRKIEQGMARADREKWEANFNK